MANTIKMGHDYMVRVPKFRISDVIPGGSDAVHPAFIINGKEVDAIYISKYQNIVMDGVAYSLPYQKPAVNIDFDAAAKACERKGAGWHLMSNAEWTAIALWCKANGTIPHGNTLWGKYYHNPDEHGLCFDGSKTLTGSGPDTWSHDHTSDGIFDLVGNVWEMVSGIRVVKGRLQVIKDNDVAAGADMSAKSKAWQDLGYGYRIDDDGLTLTTSKKVNSAWDGCKFKELKAEVEVPEQLKALGLYPVDNNIGDDYFWIDNEEAERLVYRGGFWTDNTYAGVFYFHAYNPRSNSNYNLGFRSAFAEL